MQAEEILELLPSIQYAMLCYAFGKLNKFISYGNKGPHDSYYECYFDAIGAAADIFEVHHCERYGEHNLYVSFESMMEYYRLCRIYSKLHHIRLPDNPYIKEAERYVECTMDFGEYGGYHVHLQTKVNHKWASGLVISTDDNCFNEEFELAEAIFDVGAWYEFSVHRLRKKLLEEYALWLPALPEHRKEVGIETHERIGAAA